MDFELFELLSAYLDGEVTAAERDRVEVLLATDAQARALYGSMARLETELKADLTQGPVPGATSASAMAAAVFEAIDRRSQRRWWIGGGAIAAAATAAVFSVVSGWSEPQMQLAHQGGNGSTSTGDLAMSPSPSPLERADAPSAAEVESLVERALIIE
ncbi:MAG: hypothetical protein Fur0042_03960 [Cyanophyceae cyanobacterium]